MVKFNKKFKPKFWRFQGQFDLEDLGQGHQFSNSSENFMRSIHVSSLKVKFKTIQKFTRNHTDDDNDADDDADRRHN